MAFTKTVLVAALAVAVFAQVRECFPVSALVPSQVFCVCVCAPMCRSSEVQCDSVNIHLDV